MTERSDMANLVELFRQLGQVDPHSFHGRLGELKRGGLPTTSIPEGSRSSTTPMPATDRTDGWVEIQRRAYSKGLDRLVADVRTVIAAQNAILFVMGQNVLTPDVKPGETLEQAQARAMRTAQAKAQEVIADEEPGGHRFICDTCSKAVKRTATNRPWKRCAACLTPHCENCADPLEPGRASGECPKCRVHRSRHGQSWPVKANEEREAV